MANSIKLTEEVTKKMQELKNLACADDSIISQEAKEGLVSVISALEKEITEVSDNETKSDSESLKETDENDKTNDDENAEIICNLSQGASEWDAPEFNKANLTRIDDRVVYAMDGYEHYGLCFKDLSNKRPSKPEWRNVLSIIADNIGNFITDENYKQLKKDDMILTRYNNLVYSGLFVYRAPKDGVGYVYNSDGHIDIWVPKNSEADQSIRNGIKTSYCIAEGVYPNLKGNLVSFTTIKNILLDANNVIYKVPCYHMDGLYDRHSMLYRDTTNGNLMYH